MTNRGCYTAATLVIECYDTTVIEGQLQRTVALLAGDTACNRPVDFVCKPVFTCHSLKRENAADVLVEFGNIIFALCKVGLNIAVVHHRFRRVAEHIGNSKVDSGFLTLTTKVQSVVIVGMTYNI